jgi:hypothetical protein
MQKASSPRVIRASGRGLHRPRGATRLAGGPHSVTPAGRFMLQIPCGVTSGVLAQRAFFHRPLVSAFGWSTHS